MIAVFEKGERLRHVGHLDLMRTMQRALRRSGLPIAYSQGFNPHVQVTFASALSVGVIGRREIVDVPLAGPVSEAEFLEKMNRALPPDLPLLEARALEDRHPALMASLQAAAYTLIPEQSACLRVLAATLPGFLAQEAIHAQRKTKSGMKDCDIRPLIERLSITDKAMEATLVLTERESCKPDMLLEALRAFSGLEALPCRVIREQLYGRDDAGVLQPLEAL